MGCNMKTSVNRSIAAGAAVLALAGPAAAQGADYADILTGLVATGGIAAIIGAGALKAAPGFARWLTNKVASFFR